MVRTIRTVFALAATGFVFSAATEPLRVLRVSPGAVASAGDTITITFDRPVAGSLDNAVDARTIVQLEPAVPNAAIDWRDPVTLRVIPRPALRRGTRYTISVSTGFKAMDGSSLTTAYKAEFRVRGPTLTQGDGLSMGDTTFNLDQSPRFTLHYDAPVRASDIASLSSLRDRKSVV